MINSKFHILIVDDNADFRDLLQSMLTLRGYYATSTGEVRDVERLAGYANGGQATGKVPDLIILDMLLTGGDGRHLCKQLKENPLTRGIPVVMISAYPYAEEMCKKAGADDFLIKPFAVNQLISMLKKNLSLDYR